MATLSDPSFVPSQIPSNLTQIVITTAGENGYNGSIYDTSNTGTGKYSSQEWSTIH